MLAMCYVGAFATLYQTSSFDTLQQEFHTIFQNSNQHIRFNQDITRRLFPRPTIILHDVKLIKNQDKTPLFSAKEMRIGIAWKSLWQKKSVEKLVIIGLTGTIRRENENRWNISDLLFNAPNNLHINRIYLQNSFLGVELDREQLFLNHFNLTAKRVKNAYAFNMDTQAQHPFWTQLSITQEGQAQWQNQQFNIPVLNTQFHGKEHEHAFSGSLKSNLTVNQQYFVAIENTLNLNSDRFQTSINATIDNINNQNQKLSFNSINSNYTLQNKQHRYTGSTSMLRALWQNQTLNAENVLFSINHDDPQHKQLNISLYGNATWQAKEGLWLPDLNITSQQTTFNNKIRFNLTGKGQFRLRNANDWQAQLNGAFDKQVLALNLQRKQQDIQGEIHLAQFNLNNYLDQEKTSIDQYLIWPKPDLNLKIQLNLGTLKLPSLEINNLHTTLIANHQHLQLNPLQAKLYGGSSTGYLRIDNQTPLNITLQQSSQNTAINPWFNDLFKLNYISGLGKAELNLHTQGNNRQEMTRHLSGSLKLNIKQGQWNGINFAQLFKATFGNSTHNSTQTYTPFQQLQLNSTIRQGISYHQIKTTIQEPLAELTSNGQLNLTTGEVNDDIVIKNQKTKPLPIHLSGHINHPNITLNYKKLTESTPNKKDRQKNISETFKQQWQWLKQ